MKIYILTLVSILLIATSYINAGPFDDLKKGLNEVQGLASELEGELTFPDYSPLGKRIANGEAVYENAFFWITDDGTIGSTDRGWSRVPKNNRNLVYLKKEEAEQALADASISPEEKEATRLAQIEEKEKQEAIAEEKKRNAEEKKRKAQEEKYADYEYGTKEQPIQKNGYRLFKSNEYLSTDSIEVNLSFGKGVKAKALKGKISCADAFGDEVIRESVEDMVIKNVSNYIAKDAYNCYWGGEYRKIGDFCNDRPLDSVINIAKFTFNIYSNAAKTLEAGGIESCSFTLSKAVFR